MINYYTIHEWLAHFVDRNGKRIRWALRRYRMRKGVKQYLQKPYQLTKEQKKEAKQFWKKYTRHFSPVFHELYLQKTGKFDPKYVPDDIMFCEIEDYLDDWGSSRGMDNKCNYELYFPEVKQPKTLYRKMKGVYHDAAWNIISEEDAVRMCMDNGAAVIKASQEVGYGGGVKIWDAKTDTEDDLKEIIRTIPGDVIAQDLIVEHPELKKLNTKSVSCIRVLSIIRKDKVEYLRGYFRMGQGEGKVDYADGCVASLYPDGQLYEVGFDNNTCNPVKQHENGMVFKDYKVPCYEAVRQKALELHKKLGDFRIVSWDFSVDPEGDPVLIEVNMLYGGIMYHQLGSGPIFGDKTEEILAEVFGK